MVSESREGPAHCLVEFLQREGYRFNFFQAALLLERAFPNSPAPGDTPNLNDERVRFRPATGSGFPANSVIKIQETPLVHRQPDGEKPGGDGDEAKVIEVVLSFMGLYGVASPLPSYFADAIASATPGSEALKDFLDMFNHRLYALLYQSWKKYRHYLSFRSDGGDFISQYMMCLAGLGLPAQQQAMHIPPVRAMAYAGALGSRFHSAGGLAALISDYLDGVPAQVREFMPQWLPVPERIAVGGDFRLGKNVLLGKEFLDIASKVRLTLGPLDWETFWRLRPGTPDTLAVQELFKLYSRDSLVFDFEFILLSESMPRYQLGAPDFRLGWNIFLGKPKQQYVPVVARPVSRQGYSTQTYSPADKKSGRSATSEKSQSAKPSGKNVEFLHDSAIHEDTTLSH
jgi:type VI secretion system protein ImpH